jgi:energy-coupling factor transporter transmembrane protein EcfT
MLALAVRAKLLRRFLVIGLSALLPIILVLVAVWAIILKAPPGVNPGTDPGGGLTFATVTSLRLVLISLTLFSTVTEIPDALRPEVLRLWGLRGQALLLTCGTLALPSELAQRARRAVDARLSRGIYPSRSVWSRSRHVPHVVRSLVIWTLDTAAGREEEWARRHLMTHLLNRLPVRSSRYGVIRDGVLVATGLALFLIGALGVR